jgi:hypothetical protein
LKPQISARVRQVVDDRSPPRDGPSFAVLRPCLLVAYEGGAAVEADEQRTKEWLKGAGTLPKEESHEARDLS